MNKFNVNEVRCNGVGGSGYRAVLKHMDAIQRICQEVRDIIGIEKIWELATTDPNVDYHKGTRFNSVEDNTYRLITGIAEHVAKYIPTNELIEMHVGAILPMLTMEDKVTLVVDACRDCASADHWYTFEKDWS
jgi:formylmethanofuran dehydrogenase subunit A